MTRHPRGECWYRRLLRLYPRDFRDEFGGEMARLYRDRGRVEPWWRVWASLAMDLARTAPAEHVALLRQDLRHAWRGLRRTPVITIAAMLTLALGVGAGTAVFSVVHAVLLRPLPYPQPDRLVELFEDNLATGASMRASALNYLSWAERSQRFEALAAFGGAGATLTGSGDPEVLGGSVVTASLFRVLGVAPIVGRTLQPEDERRGSSRVVVLSEPFWRTRFGADPAIVGRSITLDGELHHVIGVMPREFRDVGRSQAAATAAPQIFLPLTIDPAQENRGNHTLRVVGRLRRGVPLEQARDEMRAIGAGMAQEFPASNKDWTVRIAPLADTTLDPAVRRALLLVFGAVTIVFLIACGNVANLLMARGMRRHAELAIRTALGAGRSRLIRQLLTESACLAGLSGAAGVFVAIAAHPLVRASLPATLPRLDEMRIDLDILAFGLLLSIISGLVFGVVPAFRASRLDAPRSLAGAGRATPDVTRARLRQALVAAQIALATMLLVSAALLLQAFARLQRVPVGFEPDGVLTTRISLPRSAYPDAARTAQFYDRLLTTIEESEQRIEAAIGTSAPFAPGVRAGFQVPVPGRAFSSGAGADEGVAEHIVSGAYFRVLGIPLRAGRVFDAPSTSAPPVAVVSQRFASLVWPDRNPIGQMFERNGRHYAVIGVVGDVRGSDTQGARGGGPDRPPRAAAYFAASQSPQRTMTLLARATGDSAGVIAAIRAAVRQQDAALALQQIRFLDEWRDDSVAPTRLTTGLAASFATIALLLTSVGIYGVLAYTVTSRTREIGVRMAMGATRARVVGLVALEGMTWAAGGIAAGLLGAFAAARLIGTFLFDVPARDPMTFAAAAGAVTLVALAACAIPAARAARIDPTLAMRAE